MLLNNINEVIRIYKEGGSFILTLKDYDEFFEVEVRDGIHLTSYEVDEYGIVEDGEEVRETISQEEFLRLLEQWSNWDWAEILLEYV